MKTEFPRAAGFTFVELLASSTLIVLLMLVLVSMTDATTKTWQYTNRKIEQFQSARVGFESMTRRLSQATLNTYWEVETQTTGNGAGATTVPRSYVRRSELRFISGPMSALMGRDQGCPTHGTFFQAPIGFAENRPRYGGLTNLLNTWGYFVEVGEEGAPVPTPLVKEVKPKWRSRLKEFMEPSERLGVYRGTVDADTGFVVPMTGGVNRTWFQDSMTAATRPVRTLAENVVALVLLPQLSSGDVAAQSGKVLAPGYLYDSTAEDPDEDINPHHQLPPIVQVIMVAIDEDSARRLNERAPGSLDFGLDLSQLFKDPTLLLQGGASGGGGGATALGDLEKLESILTAKKVNYRIFNSNVIIRGAKWGRENN
jgi:uncharacterized protein (TIGR02599 family)